MQNRHSRRRFLGVAGGLGAATWLAPSITTVDAAAAATTAPVTVVATGSSGTIITSPNATTWTARTSGTTNNLKGVAYSPPLGLYAAVGSGGTILRSADGITWITCVSPTPRDLNSVEWDAKAAQFVAVGNAKTVVVSSDGIVWVLKKEDLLSGVDLLGIGADPASGTLVAVGTGGAVARSIDAGDTWVDQTSGTTATLHDVEWASHLTRFVAGGDAGTVVKSPDGVTWTVPVAVGVDPVVAVEWASTNQVVIAEDVAPPLVYATSDGTTWAPAAPPGVTASIKAVTYSACLGLYVAVGSSGSVWTSPDGSTWQSQSSPVQQNLLAVTSRC